MIVTLDAPRIAAPMRAGLSDTHPRLALGPAGFSANDIRVFQDDANSP